MLVSVQKFVICRAIMFFTSMLPVCLPAETAASQKEIKVAVATNFTAAMDVISDRYEKQTGIAIKRSASATGILYVQIINSAPFDLFLAADEKRPALLHQLELCEEPFTYATGEVVLWSTRSDLDETQDWHQTVLRNDVKRIAIPNPETAPYGEAAVQALKKSGLAEMVHNRLVYGQNVGQAFQYARQESADLAFVARTYALSELGRQGKSWDLPEAPPVVQNGCILKHNGDRETVLDFVAYLRTNEARKILATFGYE
jgi:molybdate transport system substrate-binding protein